MKWWHRWRIARLERDLRVIVTQIENIDNAYVNAYYHNLLHNLVAKRIELQSEIEYHKDRIK